ncbi:MAG: mechanosensitive ion channel family protein [Gammaproteobacteria bacterium]|nr:mechanosensitive ion channel family protein [Gammaproteobacteria bacterium]
MNESNDQMLSNLQASLKPYLGYFGENSWIQALVVIIASFIIAWIFNGFIINTLKKLAARTSFDIDNHLIDLLQRPIHTSVILLGLALATRLMGIGDPFDFIIFSVLQSIAYLVWTLLLLTVTRAVLRHFAQDDKHLPVLHPQTLPLFLNIANIAIMVFAIYIIFTAWDIDMTAWLASAGIVGIAVGFAAKDTLANLFSGVFILADAPYKIGDFVVLDSGERGEVTHIGIRSTRILTRDDVEVTIPNSVMGNTKVINESGGPAEKYRIRIAVGVAYGSDIDQVREILMNIALNNEAVCDDPEPRVRFRQFGASSLDFELLGWIDQPVLRGRVIDALNCEIYKAFIKEKIEIPYSKQDLYIKEMPK